LHRGAQPRGVKWCSLYVPLIQREKEKIVPPVLVAKRDRVCEGCVQDTGALRIYKTIYIYISRKKVMLEGAFIRYTHAFYA
jgi:hypothetical protein